MRGTILIIDDEEQLRRLLSRIITLEGFTVLEAGTVRDASQLLQRTPVDVILCDVKLPDGNGVDFIKTLTASYPHTPVILITAYGRIADGVRAMKAGAFDYLVKGDDNERILPLLHQAMEKSLRQKTISIPSTAIDTGFDSIIGNSPALLSAIAHARKIAPTDTTVLLLGETGTGKEVFATAIHRNSKRKNAPCIAINCSAFSRELLESELFGHKAGAFTGATKDKKGLLEMAAGGTLFLDEIGEMPLDLQAKMLRVLENGEFIRVGDTRISKADVRIIAATNKDLESEVHAGHFREDLFYRLNVFRITLPPLRERLEDIPLLARHFLARFANREGRTELRISETVSKLLQQQEWKGNLRELKNTMERAAILAESDTIELQDLPFELQQKTSHGDNGLSLAAIERSHIERILAYTNGNKAKAARLLEIGIATLYRKMQEYGITTLSK